MGDAGSFQGELASMRQQLARTEAAGTEQETSERLPNVSVGPELENLLHELQAKWGDASENAEALVKAHPIAALAAALLLGIALGRLMGKHS